jgi:peptidoglycan/xylan/chitin deacetylase (PgdA/CDA1 family)
MLQKHFELVDFKTFLENMQAQKPEPYAAITLDDCIKRNVDISLTVVSEERVPVTYYVPTGYSQANKSYWAYKVTKALRYRDRIVFDGRWYDVTTSRKAIRMYNRMVTHFLRSNMQTPEIERMVSDWFAQNQLSEHDFIGRDDNVISREQIKEISQNPYVTIQSHSVSHPLLSRCNETELRHEFSASKEYIETLTGRPVFSFCFPYGYRDSIGTRAQNLVTRYYGNATTFIDGVCDGHADRYFLPRIAVKAGENSVDVMSKVYHFQAVAFVKALLKPHRSEKDARVDIHTKKTV